MHQDQLTSPSTSLHKQRCTVSFKFSAVSSVSDPDRIRIQSAQLDPDPGEQKLPTKIEKS